MMSNIIELIADIRQTLSDLRNQDNERGMCDAWFKIEENVGKWLEDLINEIERLNKTRKDNLQGMRGLADTLNLPFSWVKRESIAGRIPHLRIGHRYLFNVEAVREELMKRAAKDIDVKT